jgi:hypothetical protein
MPRSRPFCVVLLAGLLAACVGGPVTTVYRLGSTFADRQDAIAACRAEAYKALPADPTLVEDRREEYVGPHYGCAYGHGQPRCGFIVDGRRNRRSIRSVDANEDLRNIYLGNCLKARGYSLIVRPLCGDEPAMRDYQTRRDDQPAESDLSCVAGDERLAP